VLGEEMRLAAAIVPPMHICNALALTKVRRLQPLVFSAFGSLRKSPCGSVFNPRLV
jgi:hypothetical protein